MENGEIEEVINRKVRASSYQIKTTATDILKIASSRKPAKSFLSSASSKRWFFGVLSVMGAVAIALAVTLPFLNQDDILGSDGFRSTDVEEPSSSALDSKVGAISFELASVMPSLSPSSFASVPLLGKKKTISSSDSFETVVTDFDKMSSSAYVALFAPSLPSLLTGTFTGAYHTYPYCLTFLNNFLFYFNLDINARKKASDIFAGELVSPTGTSYQISGSRFLRTNGIFDIKLQVDVNQTDGTYFSLEQDTTKGTFYFSISYYAYSKLSYSYSAHLLENNNNGNKTRFLQLSYQDDSSDDVFRVYVLAQGLSIYLRYVKNPITLTYSDSSRIYSYGDYSLTKSTSSNK